MLLIEASFHIKVDFIGNFVDNRELVDISFEYPTEDEQNFLITLHADVELQMFVYYWFLYGHFVAT